MTDVKEAIRKVVEGAGDTLVDLSHRIHDTPELCFEEERAAGWLCERLRTSQQSLNCVLFFLFVFCRVLITACSDCPICSGCGTVIPKPPAEMSSRVASSYTISLYSMSSSCVSLALVRKPW